MNETEFSEKMLAVAESAGLSPEDVRSLLDGGEDIPEALKEVFERIADDVSRECGKE
ncbi:hypothetical protein [Maridesulfovibrio sp.]|uniref:hypothetical protein n=1 Tax=Maridesulfovibrio sp. TaxID=2795000 RepID=UPI0039EEEA35